MRKGEFRCLIEDFANGNTSPQIMVERKIPAHEFTEVLKAFRKIEYDGDARHAMRAVAEKLIESGITLDEFVQITGYTKNYSRKLYNQIWDNKHRENDQVDDEKIIYPCQIKEVCKQFGLAPDKSIKEQWFKS